MRVRDAKVGKRVKFAPHRVNNLSNNYCHWTLNGLYTIKSVIRQGYGSSTTLLELTPIFNTVPIEPFWVSVYDVCLVEMTEDKQEQVKKRNSFVYGDTIKFNPLYTNELKKWLKQPANQKIVETSTFTYVDLSPLSVKITIGCWQLPRQWFVKA